VRTESVVHLDDLLLRRTDWGRDPETAAAVARRIAELLDGPSLAPKPPAAPPVQASPAAAADAVEIPLHAAG